YFLRLREIEQPASRRGVGARRLLRLKLRLWLAKSDRVYSTAVIGDIRSSRRSGNNADNSSEISANAAPTTNMYGLNPNSRLADATSASTMNISGESSRQPMKYPAASPNGRVTRYNISERRTMTYRS